jgi:hypothetical protein
VSLSWARVAGDVIDIALLSTVLRSPRTKRRVIGGLTALAGSPAIDTVLAVRATRAGRALAERPGAPVGHDRALARRDLPLLARPHEPAAVHEGGRVRRDPRRAPVALARPRARGAVVTWEVYLVEDRENQLIRWRTTADSDLESEGSVRFRPAPGARGTEVHFEVLYAPRRGAAGRVVTALLGGLAGVGVETDLRRLKQLLETGQIVHAHSHAHPSPRDTRVEVSP